MDDGEVELSDHVLHPNFNSSSNFQTSMSIDSIIDELLKNARTCTHTHTCNPPGPVAEHTHTCFHTHTQVLPSEEDGIPYDKKHPVLKTRTPSGNREAVRKYREKKKAHTVYLEEEVKKLQLVNQQLVRKLQGQAILEAEVLRLRCLLLDFRGKIDNELGVFPFQKQCNTTTTFKEGDCGVLSTDGVMGLRCENDNRYFHPDTSTSLQATSNGGSEKMVVSSEGYCQPPIIDCRANTNGSASAEGCTPNSVETFVSSVSQAE